MKNKVCKMCKAPAVIWAVLGSTDEVFLCSKCEIKMNDFIVEVHSL